MLAIVEHDQQMPCLKLLGERVGQRLSGSLVDVHRPTKGRCDQFRFAHPLQVHPTGPVGKPRRHVPCDLHRQPRLAATTRTGQRHHPGVRDQIGHLRTFTLAADKRRHPNRHPALHLHWLHLPDRTSTPSHAPPALPRERAEGDSGAGAAVAHDSDRPLPAASCSTQVRLLVTPRMTNCGHVRLLPRRALRINAVRHVGPWPREEAEPVASLGQGHTLAEGDGQSRSRPPSIGGDPIPRSAGLQAGGRVGSTNSRQAAERTVGAGPIPPGFHRRAKACVDGAHRLQTGERFNLRC